MAVVAPSASVVPAPVQLQSRAAYIVPSSPLFGKSNSLAGGFFSPAASNRSVDLQLMFSF
jgi:hypothetical protein